MIDFMIDWRQAVSVLFTVLAAIAILLVVILAGLYALYESIWYRGRDTEVYIDEVGGHHECGLGWDPDNVFCGECSIMSCAGCPQWDHNKEKKSNES